MLVPMVSVGVRCSFSSLLLGHYLAIVFCEKLAEEKHLRKTRRYLIYRKPKKPQSLFHINIVT